MTLGSQIAAYRKKLGITQETLAQQLGVTNQAVSKWEADQCCPDVMLLPKIAEIFSVSIDTLFGREMPVASAELPWENDGTLRAVLFIGRRLVKAQPASGEIQFRYDGEALNIQSDFSVFCGDIEGNAEANGSIHCGDIEGNVKANGNVLCGDIEGDAHAGGNVNSADIEGNVQAGGAVTCKGDVCGNVTAGGDVSCGDVEGDASAGGNMTSGDVCGNVTAGGDVNCGDVEGCVMLGKSVWKDEDETEESMSAGETPVTNGRKPSLWKRRRNLRHGKEVK